MKRVAILQSNYIPWKGYFDIIASVDEFILFDDIQFTKNDWRNRNKIKTPNGVQWLSIPVGAGIGRTIREVPILSNHWQSKHWKTLESNYRRSPYFAEISAWLKPLYNLQGYTYLSEVNRLFIEAVCQYLKIKTVISNSWDYTLLSGKSERLANLCEQAGGSVYISGPAAKNYIEEMFFVERGIKIVWFDYEGYQKYPQLWGGFSHEVTILDLLFNTGKNAGQYMKFVNQ
jgi:hypothetical protein